jgi:hypothetical protein
VAVEGATAGRGLEEDGAERPDVDARADHAAHELLWSHVWRRADAALRLRRRLFAERLRDAEVDDRRGVVAQDHVRRLEIAMNDAAIVRGLHTVGKRRPDAADVGFGERAAREARREGFAVDALHHEEALAGGLVAPEVDHAHHRWMCDRARALGLGAELIHTFGVAQELDRDGVAEEAMGRGVHLARRARAEPRSEGVVPDLAS